MDQKTTPKNEILIDRSTFWWRLHQAMGPIVGGMIIDAVDFATFGPIGIYSGLIIGGIVGWWVSGLYRFTKKSRLMWAAAAGVYCTLPFTEVLPFASILSVAARFFAPTLVGLPKAANRSHKQKLCYTAFFDSGSAKLDIQTSAELNQLIERFKSTTSELVIKGYADSHNDNGNYVSQWELAGARAVTLVRTLESKGIESSRLSAVSFGDSRSINSDNQDSNRRVELWQ